MSAAYLSIKEVLRLHFQIIEDFGGSHGVRDEASLRSVIHAPQQIVFGIEQYPTLYEKAAVYIRNIVGDHPFTDGNKRTAVTVAAIFLGRGGKQLHAAPAELENFIVRVTTDRLDIHAIASWLETYTD